MKRIIIVFALIIGLFLSVSANELQEVLYLKNGSIIKGTIIEQVPEETVKIQTYDGSLFVYPMSDVLKITKEKNNRVEDVNDKKIKSGPKLIADFGGVFLDDYGRIEVSATYGYQFNSYLYLGGGLGLGYEFTNDLVLPLFVELRYTPLKKKITPYIDVKYGVDAISGYSFFTPMIGCRVGMSENKGLNLGVGFEFYSGITMRVGFDF